jgi:hypothetical protein
MSPLGDLRPSLEPGTTLPTFTCQVPSLELFPTRDYLWPDRLHNSRWPLLLFLGPVASKPDCELPRVRAGMLDPVWCQAQGRTIGEAGRAWGPRSTPPSWGRTCFI